MPLHRPWGDGLTLKEAIDKISPLWGMCSFDKIKDGLIKCRAESRLPKNSETVIVVCFPYLLDASVYEGGNISKYAVVTDYHEVALSRLNAAMLSLQKIYENEEFAGFADNSPIPEVRAACIAGLGVRGENSLLITEKYGSYVFIGTIVTSAKLNVSENEIKPCLKCGRCKSACPSGAICENGFERKLCLSEITQKKGELSENEKKLMKECGCVWGCDVCQTVCPMNKNAAKTEIKEFLNSPKAILSEGCDLEGRAYEWRGRKVIERNLKLLLD